MIFKTKPSKTFIGIWLFLNLAASILLVLLNKWLYVHIGFPNVTMTCSHFIMTFIGLQICRQFQVFKEKYLPIKEMLPLACTFCGFVAFTNLSLGHNSVGTYQIFKTLTMPCVMIIQSLYYKTTFTRKIKMTLVPLISGVVIGVYFDIKFNLIGLLFAIIGVVVTSLYQVWVGEKQKEFQVNSMQLLYYQAPLSAILLCISIPFIEPPWAPGGLFSHYWTCKDLIMVLLSGIIAFIVNLSIYWIIGNTSALTYNVTGQAKFCFTLMGGYLLFHDPLNYFQLIGISLTFFGILAYTHFKNQEYNEKSLPKHSNIPKS